nr:13401_t:CDS:2 [Entrophospora candida]
MESIRAILGKLNIFSHEKIEDNKNSNNSLYLSSDENELARLQTFHFFTKESWRNLFTAPIEDLLLNSTWTMDMATTYTKPSYIGIDKLPLFPTEIKPNHVEFKLVDVLEGLPFEDNTFDFVYMEHMKFHLREDDYLDLLNEIIRVVKPGGWMEILEFDKEFLDSGPIDSSIHQEIKKAIYEKYKINFDLFPKIKSALKQMQQDGNIQYINDFENKLVIGKWGGKIGEVFLQGYKTYLINFKDLFTELILSCDNNSNSFSEIKSMFENNYEKLLEIIVNEFNQCNAYCYNFKIIAQKKC